MEGNAAVFREKELRKYLKKMDPKGWEEADIRLLTSQREGLRERIQIDVRAGKGTIAGNGEGALLLGIYRFLYHLGCRFIRPGEDGERIPRLRREEWTVICKEEADFPHRGAVIEGADSLEHVLDYIDWLPKIGMNSFFTQFTDFRLFFERYYSHIHNPGREPEEIDDFRYRQMEGKVYEHIRVRGLRHHAVGHGWTSECLGIPGRDWYPVDEEPSEELRGLLAQVDGKRGFFQKVPAETNLCYSNSAARKRLEDYVLRYLKEHPSVDYLHVWLADAPHSFCECEACRKKTPSDWYVVLLNELDERLTEEGLDTRIVFLLYYDLLWPPITERFRNKKRFTMMFAPITRSFESSFGEAGEASAGEYELNVTPIPGSIQEMLGLLRGWQRVFDGDSFDFDYYQGRAHYGDPGYMRISKVIDKDISALENIGLGGILSCQELRAFFPTALPDYVLGMRLWDSGKTYSEIREEYLRAAFGERWELCAYYLDGVSEGAPVDYWYHFCQGKDLEAAQRAAGIAERAEEFERRIREERLGGEDVCVRLSWFYLQYHAAYTRLWMRTVEARAKGEDGEAASRWEELTEYLCANERMLERAFDVYRLLDLGKTAGFGRAER